MSRRGLLVVFWLGSLISCARDGEVLAPQELPSSEAARVGPEIELELLLADPLVLRWKGDRNGPFPDSPEQSRHPTLGFGRPHILAWRVGIVDGFTTGPLYRASQIDPRAYLPAAAGLGHMAKFAVPNDTPPEQLPPEGCDGGPDCPELRRWESGRHEFELLALDALGRVRQLDEGRFEFDANYPPESSIVVDEQYPRYVIDDGQGGLIENVFAAGDTIPDGAYVLIRRGGYDRFEGSVDDPDSFCCDERLDPQAPEVRFQTRLEFEGREDGRTRRFETLYSSPDVPDTIGFAAGPFDYHVLARTLDEHDRRDETPSTFDFVAGYPPRVDVVSPSGADAMILRNPLAGVPWPENEVPYDIPTSTVALYWDGLQYHPSDGPDRSRIDGHFFPLVLRFDGSADPREVLNAVRSWSYSLRGEYDPDDLVVSPGESSDLTLYTASAEPNRLEVVVEIFVPALLWSLPEAFEPGSAVPVFEEAGAYLRRWLGEHTLRVKAKTTRVGDTYTYDAFVRPSQHPIDVDVGPLGRRSEVVETTFTAHLGLDPTGTGTITRLWPDGEVRP